MIVWRGATFVPKGVATEGLGDTRNSFSGVIGTQGGFLAPKTDALKLPRGTVANE